MAHIQVPSGVKGVLDFDLPSENLALDTAKKFPGPLPDLGQAVMNALENPVAGPPFSQRLAQAHTVCILVDNFARLTPAHKLLPPTPEAIHRLFEDMFYGKQALWHACLWMPIIQTMARKEVIVVTEPERLEDFALNRITAVTSLDQADQLAQEKHGSGMRVGNFPYGKWVLPTGLNDPSNQPERY